MKTLGQVAYEAFVEGSVACLAWHELPHSQAGLWEDIGRSVVQEQARRDKGVEGAARQRTLAEGVVGLTPQECEDLVACLADWKTRARGM